MERVCVCVCVEMKIKFMRFILVEAQYAYGYRIHVIYYEFVRYVVDLIWNYEANANQCHAISLDVLERCLSSLYRIVDSKEEQKLSHITKRLYKWKEPDRKRKRTLFSRIPALLWSLLYFSILRPELACLLAAENN